MPRLGALVVFVLSLIVLAVWWIDRTTSAPVDSNSPATTSQPGTALPAVAATGETAPREAPTPERLDASPDKDAPEFIVRGFVLADPRAPDLTSARVLAFRGEPHDTSGILPGSMASGQRRVQGPAFVLVGDAIGEATVAADGGFELRSPTRHLRISLDHDLYLQPMPEIVHVSTTTRTAHVVLSPMLGGCLRGRLLGARASEVEHVRLTLEPDPMSMLRDSRAMMAAMLAAIRPPATPLQDGTFVFRGVTPGAKIVLDVTGGRASARSREAALQAGEVRDVVLPIATAAILAVTVVDESGNTIADAMVSARPADSGSMTAMIQAQREHTDGSGTGTFTSVEPGNYIVEAMSSGRTAASETIEVRSQSEPTRLRLVLGEGGVVTGTVLAPDGSPVKDAKVAHHPSTNIPVLGDMAEQLGPEMLANATEGGALTDEHGTFRLTGLDDDSEFLVIASHADHAVGMTSQVKMGDTDITVTLQPLSGVSGQVLGADTEEPLEEFTVALLRTTFLIMEMPVRRDVVRDADGRFLIDHVSIDNYTLQIEADGYSTLRKSIKLTPEGPLEVGALELPRAASIRGIVRGKQGQPVRGALVRKRRGAMADNPMIAMLQGGQTTAYSDAEGHFDLGPLPPGRLQLLASATGYASGRSERLEITAGQQLEHVVIELGHGGAIQGRLVCGAGQQPGDFLLLAQHIVTQDSKTIDFDPDGSFLIENLDPGGYQVQAMPHQLLSTVGSGTDWKPGQGIKIGELIRKITDNVVSQRCTVRSGETSETTLDVSDLTIGSQWFVHVEVGGKLQRSGMVEATSLDDGTLRVAMLQDGVATFGRMQPGNHRLQVRSGLSMTPVGEPRDLEYPSGAETHRSTLRLPGGELHGRVVDAASDEPLRSAIVRLLHDGQNERDDATGVCLTDADGAFVFTGLTDGTYSLMAAEPLLTGAGNTASRRSGIEVVAGTTTEPIELRARPAAGASVLVTDPGGQPITGATVLCVDDGGRPLGSLGLAATGPDGRAWFGGMVNGPARVVGRATGYAPAASMVLRLAAEEATEFSLTLTRGAPTSLSIVNGSGAKLRGAALTARCNDGPWLPTLLLVQRIGKDGSFDLGRLGAGSWQFRITHRAIGTVTHARTIQGNGPVTIVVTAP